MIRSTITKRLLVAALAVTGLSAVSAVPANAHASAQMYGETAKTGSYGAVFVRVPHAAANVNTVKIEVQIPAGVTAVKPQRVAGWNERTTLDAEGKNVATVIWENGSLPDTSFQDFGIQVKFPATAGVVYFKTVQTLSDGSTTSWIEIPAAGVDAHSLAHPAPSVVVAVPSTGHGATTPVVTTPVVAPTFGEISAVLDAKSQTLKLIGDTSTTNSGKKYTVRVTRGTGTAKAIVNSKLDTRGDFTKSVVTSRAGKLVVDVRAGDKIELVVGTKVLATTTVTK